ncbi:MAG: ATP-dependent helicase [Methanosarcina sp.]
MLASRIKIFGPPGCGKTTKLMDNKHGYQYLLSRGFQPEDITLITYRKSAAHDLIEKVHELTGFDEKEIKRHVGTIHSICLRLLLRTGIIGGRLGIIDDDDKYEFALKYDYLHCAKVKKLNIEKEEEDEDIVEELEEDEDIEAVDDEPECTGDMFELYNWCRSTCASIEDFDNFAGYGKISLSTDEIVKFFEDWDSYKKGIGKVDFSDMLELILKNNIQLDTPVLMVDEFQDLTPQMNKIFWLWSLLCDYVIIAGDPNQSIYGYAGGSPDFFTNWEADRTIILQETYRLPMQIKNICNEILEAEEMEPTPVIYAKNGCGNVIKDIDYRDEYPVHNSAFYLVRCNFQIPGIAMHLAKEGKIFSVHSHIYRGLGWSAAEIDLANAIIAVRTERSLRKDEIIAIIKRFPSTILEIDRYGKTEKDRKSGYIKEFLGKDVLYFPQIQDGTGILRPKVIEILTSSDPTQGMTQPGKNALPGKQFLAKMQSLIDRKDFISYDEAKQNRVMTIHSSKGLEADAIFLHTGMTPAIQRSMRGSLELAEAEARVWNVGASRAREILYIVRDKGKNYALPGNVSYEDVCPEGIKVSERIIDRSAYEVADW